MSEAVEAEIIEPEEASELTVAYSPAVIEANFDALEAHVRRLVADYEGATYDMGKDENVKAAKRDRAYLNGIAKEIDERRKAVSREYTKPLAAFEDRCLAQDWETLKAQFQGEPFYDEAERELFATLDLGAAITAAHKAEEERRRIAELKAAMEPEPVEEEEPEAVPEPAERQTAEFPQPLEQMPEPQPAPMPAPVPPAPPMPAPAPVAMAGDPWTIVVPCATREQMQGVAAALKAQGVVGTIMHGTVGQVYERMNGGY